MTDACGRARDRLAAAPAPDDVDSETAFLEAARQAATTVGDVADELAGHGDGRTVSDLGWQLDRFPSSTNAQQPLRVAHDASAAIMRIDGFARTLAVPECGAATWRPADWLSMARRHADDTSAARFREQLGQLCADTFPNPALLADGVPLLEAVVGEPEAAPEDVKGQLLARLNASSSRPADAGRFIRDFANGLPDLHPPAGQEQEYTRLLAAFVQLESVVPRVTPEDLAPAVRERVGAALDELEDAWEALEIAC